MRAVIQTVKYAKVSIKGELKAHINNGLLVFLAVAKNDTMEDVGWVSKKISNLRIFYDKKGVKNISIKDIGGEILAISNFTLFARIKKGNRPSYIDAAEPTISKPMYEKFIAAMEKELQKPIKTGLFSAYMQVELLNDGPITILIDSKNRM